MNLFILAQSGAEEVRKGWGSLIFVGVFFLVLIGLGMWWLKRSA